MEPAYATLLSRLRALGIRPENRSETELATIWDAYLEGLVQHDHHNVLTPEERAYDERHAQVEELQSASIIRARAEVRRLVSYWRAQSPGRRFKEPPAAEAT
jgi:predicted secreted Zn-dependent protease